MLRSGGRPRNRGQHSRPLDSALDNIRLPYEAEQMRLLQESSMWPVVVQYLESLREDAVRMAMQAATPDQEMHHWRGVYTGLSRALGLPHEVIEYEKASRRSA